MPGNTCTVWRSKSQVWAGVGFGVFVILVGLTQVGRPVSKGGGPVITIVAAVIGLVMVALFLRVALITEADGIRIRNPLRSGFYSWDQIDSFRIGRHGLFSKTCVVDLIDGGSTYAFAIQVPNFTSVEKSKELAMTKQLNQLLAARQRKDTS